MRGITNTTTSTKSTPLAPVILGLVPRILLQRVPNLVNKLALLLNKCWFSAFCMFFKYPSPEAYASPSPARGEGSGLLRRCTPRIDAVTNGKGLPRPWCHKILGTRPSMTGARGTYSFGRSMIEMLGVLAIIAVLSVGGIAGYSKAMEKFKINKMIDEYSYLINGILEHIDNLKKTSAENTSLTTVVSDMNLFPPTWKLGPNSNIGPRYRDSFGNVIDIYHGNANDIVFEIYLTSLNKQSSYSTAICTSLIQNFVQPMHYNLHFFWFWVSGGAFSYYYGDNYAASKRKLIKDLTVVEIQQICQTCRPSQSCSIYLAF